MAKNAMLRQLGAELKNNPFLQLREGPSSLVLPLGDRKKLARDYKWVMGSTQSATPIGGSCMQTVKNYTM